MAGRVDTGEAVRRVGPGDAEVIEMLVLISIGLLAGVITGVSPCVLPVLPVVFFAGGAATASRTVRHMGRPLATIAGLVLSFSLFTLFGSIILTALHLPQTLLRWAGLAALLLIGLGLLFPRVDEVLQRPFQRLPRAIHPPDGQGNAFLLGLGVGVLYVPCAGPVLAAISIAGAGGRFTGSIAVLTVGFAVGVAIPLFVFALAGSKLSQRISSYRGRRRGFRIAGGTVMVLLAVALTFNLTDGLQRTVPNYTQALQDTFENSNTARNALSGLLNEEPSAGPASTPVKSPAPAMSTAGPAKGPVVTCVSHAKALANCGPAPEFADIASWINTSGDKPVTLAQFRGKVVLVNFWTFSCINCQRALPFVRSWYADYHSSGLEEIGIHTPEFAFEHDLGNVRDAVKSDAVSYPVGLDNSSATWRTYRNSYWPAQYLIDAQGVVRHVVYGEGGYADSEILIRGLLEAADPAAQLPSPTDPAVPAP